MSSHSSASFGFIKNLHPDGEPVLKTVEGMTKQLGVEGTMRGLQHELGTKFRGFVPEKKEKPADSKPPLDAAKTEAKDPEKTAAKPENAEKKKDETKQAQTAA